MGAVFFDDVDLDVDQQDKFAAFRALSEARKCETARTSNDVQSERSPVPQKKPKQVRKSVIGRAFRKLSVAPEEEEPPSPQRETVAIHPKEPGSRPPPYSLTDSCFPTTDQPSSAPRRSLATEADPNNVQNPVEESQRSFPVIQTGDPGLWRTNKTPSIAQCVTHLKFLHACYDLREKISNSEELFGIPSSASDSKLHELAKEKRWAVYVARAADRFAVWWEAQRKSLGCENLRQSKMSGVLLDEASDTMLMDSDHLPPIDVLMVWHAFMLNPRAYLEDCLRMGATALWYHGFPWSPISESIDDATGEYCPPSIARRHFEETTSLHWDNLEDSSFKLLTCRSCFEVMKHPWTINIDNMIDTSTRSLANANERAQVINRNKKYRRDTGYADANFLVRCPSCELAIGHEVLRGEKLRKDIRLLLGEDAPMPGTILTIDGEPKRTPGWSALRSDQINLAYLDARLFPNRLLGPHGLGYTILQTLHPNGPKEKIDPNVNHIRATQIAIEKALKDKDCIIHCEEIPEEDQKKKLIISKEQRIYIRRMLSRYWDNSSPFALDLAGAVIRQGEFIRKMFKIDWVHSPGILSTMDRLIVKYTRFMRIMALRSPSMTVPTLDVDLAWHTHQLSPPMYYNYTRQVTGGRFVDHDDKIEESVLSKSFAETSRDYQRNYGEPYSVCTCWYCEATRSTHTKSTARVFQRSSIASINALLPSTPSDPDRTPHISTHNAVRPPGKVAAVRLSREHSDLDAYYSKAYKRALKDERTIGTKDVSGNTSNGAVVITREGKIRKRDSYCSDSNQLTLIPGEPCYFGYPEIYPFIISCASTDSGAIGNCVAGTCGWAAATGSCASSDFSGGAGGGDAAGGAVGGCGSGGCGGDGGGCGGCGGCGGD